MPYHYTYRKTAPPKKTHYKVTKKKVGLGTVAEYQQKSRSKDQPYVFVKGKDTSYGSSQYSIYRKRKTTKKR